MSILVSFKIHGLMVVITILYETTTVIRAKPTSAVRTSMPALTPVESPCLALGCVLWFEIVPVPLVLAGFSINEDQIPCPAPVTIAGFSLSQ
jgi:hypothetical protein